MSRAWIVDTLERTAATFLEVFIAGLIAPGVLEAVGAPAVNMTGVKAAALAALVSALTVIKSALASLVGNRNSASVVQ